MKVINALSMKVGNSLILIIIIFASSAISCQSEFGSNPVIPIPVKGSPTTICKVSSVEKNILGEWRFISTLAGSLSAVTGVVTFNSDGSVAGPVLIFGDNVTGSNLKRSYTIKKDANTSFGFVNYLIEIKTFADRQSIPPDGGGYGSVLLTVKSNECLKIELITLGNQRNGQSLILSR